VKTIFALTLLLILGFGKDQSSFFGTGEAVFITKSLEAKLATLGADLDLECHDPKTAEDVLCAQVRGR